VPRLVIIDDDRGMRLLARIVAEETGWTVAGDAETAVRGVAAAVRLRPEVAIVDHRLPDADGVQVTARILAERPSTRVVAWTSREDDAVRDAFRRAGAAEVVFKRDLDRLRELLASWSHPAAQFT
jgi:DNA-binding NarL/FixJ family response regulator